MESNTFAIQNFNALKSKANVSKLERIARITAGAYLLYTRCITTFYTLKAFPENKLIL